MENIFYSMSSVEVCHSAVCICIFYDSFTHLETSAVFADIHKQTLFITALKESSLN